MMINLFLLTTFLALGIATVIYGVDKDFITKTEKVKVRVKKSDLDKRALEEYYRDLR